MGRKVIGYFSTNRLLSGGFISEVSFQKALIMGQAPDGGLFMPNFIPQVSTMELEQMMRVDYWVIANMILRKFFAPEEIGFEELLEVSRASYNFSVPIEHVTDRQYVMRLDRGPTASFKDFAARAMARLMSHFRDQNQRLHVLVATSGDTGSAVGEAFKGVEGIDVTILYPLAEVSGRQKKQLDTIGGNVQTIAIEDGKFDDCQDLVKQAFSDSDLTGLNLTSANSINIGRILPQIIYYFYAYTKLANGKEPIFFSVPSGNFGNMLGCEYARRMGLPIVKLIIATNENDEFPRFVEAGEYKKISPSRACLSNAMNVGHPSNLARLFELYQGTVDKNGKVYRYPRLDLMREGIFAVSISDWQTRQAIKRASKCYGVILEPHGAVGWEGLGIFLARYPEARKYFQVFLETAHPAKFPEVIKEELGVEPELPFSMKNVDQRTGSPLIMQNDYSALKKYLLRH